MIPMRCPAVFCGKEYHELAAAVAALRAKNKAKAQPAKSQESPWGCLIYFDIIHLDTDDLSNIGWHWLALSLYILIQFLLNSRSVLGSPSNQRTRSSTLSCWVHFGPSCTRGRLFRARAKHLNEDRCWRRLGRPQFRNSFGEVDISEWDSFP